MGVIDHLESDLKCIGVLMIEVGTGTIDRWGYISITGKTADRGCDDRRAAEKTVFIKREVTAGCAATDERDIL